MADESATAEQPESGTATRSRAVREVDPEQFAAHRIFHPQDGPAILRHEWAIIAGALHEDLAKFRAGALSAEKLLNRGDILKRIEKWLGEVEKVDNGMPGHGAPEQDGS